LHKNAFFNVKISYFVTKNDLFLHFFSKIFGQFKKLLYLCTRF